jgi:hypothetical protein
MKRVVHWWQYLAEFFLEWEMFQSKGLQKIKTHFMFNISPNFHPKLCIYSSIFANLMMPHWTETCWGILNKWIAKFDWIYCDSWKYHCNTACFLCDVNTEYRLHKKYRCRFKGEVRGPSRACSKHEKEQNSNTWNSFRKICSIVDRNWTHGGQVPCEEKPDGTGARLVTPPRKSLLLLSC